MGHFLTSRNTCAPIFFSFSLTLSLCLSPSAPLQSFLHIDFLSFIYLYFFLRFRLRLRLHNFFFFLSSFISNTTWNTFYLDKLSQWVCAAASERASNRLASLVHIIFAQLIMMIWALNEWTHVFFFLLLSLLLLQYFYFLFHFSPAGVAKKAHTNQLKL